VDPENRVSARDLYISVIEVERLVAGRNPFTIALFDVIA